MRELGNPSNYLMTKIFQDHLNGSYLALYRSDPRGDDSGAEVGTAGYQRQSVALGSPYFEGGALVAKNTSVITFAGVDGGYGDISHVGLRNAQYGGDLLFREALPSPINIADKGKIEIKAGDLKVTLW